MDEDSYWIPRNLDAPALFFIWEVDTAMIAIVLVILGSVMNMFPFGVAAAYFCCKGYARLKEEGGQGLIKRILYWYTPSTMWLSKTLPSNIREYLGG